MITPGRSLVVLCLLPCVLSLGLLVAPGMWPAIVLIDALIVGLSLADSLTLAGPHRFLASRECDTILSLGEQHRVVLSIDNRTRRRHRIQVRDDHLAGFACDPEEHELLIPGKSRAVTHYTLTPGRRGSFTMEFVYVRSASRMGLWCRIHQIPVATQLRVYPDLKQITRYALYARLDRLSLLGVRQSRRFGSANEFERLRDYTTDDNYRHLDWRATARRRKLIVRDYQANHNQRVVFMIDGGRMMMNEAAGHSLLDHALDAMLMLAHVALTQGDEVGLLTFSDQVHRWVPLGSGARHQNRLVHAVHDLFPNLVESRYDEAFLYLNHRCRKRSLVILITNLIDDVNANQVTAQLSNVTGRHLPMGVLLRDHELFDAVPSTEGQRHDELVGGELYRAAAAADILSWRDQVLSNLRHQGVLTLDVFPEDLTAPLINEYLRIKARHLL
ncbi:hypothetical protein Pan216_31120 [Planctomycetes bacterium Pan216]|uniref:DUF58 domain-containing protein n=1 Tax=Kolteria novifilia TaxID=2527975 RepID=A0A518B5K3_9BACT|nr:hypothetical protein Pan216_31120 [Planctomycetes bacterium Pan216]